MLQRVGIEKNVNRSFRVSRKHRPRKRRPQTTDKSHSSSFLFLLLFAVLFPIFQISNIQKWIMKGVIGQKKQLISRRRKAQIVM